ncbi:MBL fold metallo-hydrolase [Flavisolibacter ginsenosidimutans]|uniref:MBL fold metallo-hydrolase n=1 Tax=Flavisolibacter ginsenosidimutans TaxID=661481 RepID=A0A5B8UD57_9BACT|nr:MBL fold metallo-hydrolase [Flavisolibacter ginsenosidimutans]QEC54617.1 MBL fold metallo-hydrolase [Flavisolibacter ginsenosidimutans]
MAVEVCSIASGSNGNCYYVGNENEAVLVDAGISCKEIELRMKRAGLSLQKVKAVFVSHEHTDHISGLPVLAKKYKLPVFISEGTLKGSRLWFEKSLLHHFTASEDVVIGDLTVHPFSKLHDAADPFSFTVSCNNTIVGVITDIGKACENVVYHFQQCHAVFLESNYDEQMLDKGRYPFYLKNRIRNGYGHISNRQALDLFLQHRSPSLSHLFLSHLSYNNNCPKLVEDLFAANAGKVKTIVTSRSRETEVYKLAALSALLQNNFDAFVQQPQLAFSF